MTFSVCFYCRAFSQVGLSLDKPLVLFCFLTHNWPWGWMAHGLTLVIQECIFPRASLVWITGTPLWIRTYPDCCFWGSAGQLKNRIAVWTSEPTKISALIQTRSFNTPAASQSCIFFNIYIYIYVYIFFYPILRQSWFRSGTPSLLPPTPGSRRRSWPSTSWRPPGTWKVSNTSCTTLATEAFLRRRYGILRCARSN